MSDSLGKRPPKSRAYYRKSFKKRRFGSGPRLLYAGPGIQGVLITTGDKVKLCVPEAYNLLNEYGDELYGSEEGHLDTPSDAESSNEEEAVTKATSPGPEKVTKATAEEAKPPANVTKATAEVSKERRFTSMESGANHVVFVKCSAEINPTELVHTMLSDIAATKVAKSRFCQRILPVVRVCHASSDDIRKCALEVLEPHFHGNTTDSHTFAVHYKSRNNSAMKRDQVINLVAGLVTMEDQYPHRVNFDHPELTIIVEIIKNLCCLAVVRDFDALRKYNIQSLTQPPTTPPPKVGAAPAKGEDLPPKVGAALAKGEDLPPMVGAVPAKGEDLPPKVGAAPAKGEDLSPKVGAAPAKGEDLPSMVGAAPAKGEDLAAKVGATPATKDFEEDTDGATTLVGARTNDTELKTDTT